MTPDDAPMTPVARSAAEVADLARDAGTVGELDDRVSACRACPRLVSWREEVATVGRRASFRDQTYWGRPVPGFGPEDARILIVGLAPAAHGANRTGRMFTGDRSGEWLFAALHRAGLASSPNAVAADDGLRLHGVRIVAAVRCAPPGNAPTAAELTTCRPWLMRELELAGSVRSILALGQIAWRSTLAAAAAQGWSVPRPRPRFGHGQRVMLTTEDGSRRLPVLASYHVSQQNTFTGRLTREMLDAVLTGL